LQYFCAIFLSLPLCLFNYFASSRLTAKPVKKIIFELELELDPENRSWIRPTILNSHDVI
jgi:hypothetical protein